MAEGRLYERHQTKPIKTIKGSTYFESPTLIDQPGFNRAAVAVANKNARIIWAVLYKGQPYQAAF